MLAGASKGISDLLQFHFWDSIFSNPDKFKTYFWNPEYSWENKWTIREFEDGIRPDTSSPRFFGSTTFLVWTTDGFHLAQFFLIKFVFIAVLTHSQFTWLDFIGICSWYFGFWLTYESKLLRKQTKIK
jgi:hypothetical protein